MHNNYAYIRNVFAMSKLFWSRSISIVMLGLVFLLFQNNIFADDSAIERHVVTGESGILLKSGDDGAFVIGEGRISAIEGYTVRILPGTHIKSGDEISVSIVSKEYHEQLAAEAAREKRSETVASILERRDDAPAVPDAETLFRNLQPMPGSSVVIGQQLAGIAVLPVRTQTSQPVHTAIIYKHILSFDKYDHHVSSFRPVCCPDLSWGKRAECIGVMLA